MKFFLAFRELVHQSNTNGISDSMAISQKPVTVKLNKEQIQALETAVKLGEFEGRSHLIREVLLTFLHGMTSAVHSGKGFRGIAEWQTRIKAYSPIFDLAVENAQKIKDVEAVSYTHLTLPTKA